MPDNLQNFLLTLQDAQGCTYLILRWKNIIIPLKVSNKLWISSQSKVSKVQVIHFSDSTYSLHDCMVIIFTYISNTEVWRSYAICQGHFARNGKKQEFTFYLANNIIDSSRELCYINIKNHSQKSSEAYSLCNIAQVTPLICGRGKASTGT